MFMTRHRTKEITSEVVMVETMMGSELAPTLAICPKLSPNPSKMTAYWRIFLEVYLMARGGGFRDTRALTQHVSHHHADENGEDGTTDDLESPPQQPGRHRDHQRQRHPAPQVLEILEELHASTFPNLNVATCSS